MKTILDNPKPNWIWLLLVIAWIGSLYWCHLYSYKAGVYDTCDSFDATEVEPKDLPFAILNLTDEAE